MSWFKKVTAGLAEKFPSNVKLKNVVTEAELVDAIDDLKVSTEKEVDLTEVNSRLDAIELAAKNQGEAIAASETAAKEFVVKGDLTKTLNTHIEKVKGEVSVIDGKVADVIGDVNVIKTSSAKPDTGTADDPPVVLEKDKEGKDVVLNTNLKPKGNLIPGVNF